MAEKDPPGVITGTNSLERALALLELVEKTPGGLRNAEISRRLRMPKSTCSWILTRLARAGYLMCDGTQAATKSA